MSKVMKVMFALALAACADQSADPAGDTALVQQLDDHGAVVGVAKSTGELRDAHQRWMPAPSELEPRTSGCTHIQFCNAPGADEVVCITNDKTTGACTPNARLNECISDADFVCGNWTNMTLKPPISF